MTERRTAVDRLNDQLEDAEAKIEELEGKIEEWENKFDALKDGQEWAWRHIRELTEAENLGLPLPRLEIRYRKYNDYEVIADYGLVHRHLIGKIDFIPFGSTKIGGRRSTEEGNLELPFRDGGHIMNDMWELKLPAYVVNGKAFKEITLDDPDDLPHALKAKMKPQRPGAIP